MNNIYDILKDKLNSKSIIIECGGHLGTDTIKLSKIFNKGIIYCIEANINLYDKLKVKFNQINNIKLFNFALSNKNKIIDFYIDNNKDGDNGASSLLKCSDFYLKDYIKEEIKIKVQGMTLYNFLNKNKIQKVNLLWLDVEGFEYYIIQNSINCLKNIEYIYTEVNFQEFRKEIKLYDDIKKLLLENNFKEINKWTQGGKFGEWQANILFKNINY